MAGLGSTCNEDGLEQVRQVMVRNGVTDIPVAHYTTIHDTLRVGRRVPRRHVLRRGRPGRRASINPARMDYQAYRWLDERGFKFIEVPPDEQRLSARRTW